MTTRNPMLRTIFFATDISQSPKKIIKSDDLLSIKLSALP